MAAGRGGEAGVTARERLGQAQATLAEVKAKQLAGELVEVAEVESFWRSKLRALRGRILNIADGMHTLPAKELVRELRAALSELRTHNSSAVIGPAGFSFPPPLQPR